MNIALWIVQVGLALAFFMAGAMKVMTPLDELAAQMSWVSAVPDFVPRLAGTVEILGAIGLILPSVTRILPRLTPIAAMGLVTVMVLAAGLHISLAEFGMLGPNVVLGALAAFVAWGRLKRHPIVDRSQAPKSVEYSAA